MNLHNPISHESKPKNNSGQGRLFFQPKLTVNQPNDSYEQEADQMADKVMRMPGPLENQNAFFKPAINKVQRKCQACEEEEEKHVHRKENNRTEVKGSDELDGYVNSLRHSGQPMPESSRQFFEPRFGRDFSNVRLHTNAAAAESARSINALAYTTGNNIVFNSGQYSPDSDSGKKLIAHELTHVVQQNNGAQGVARIPDRSGTKDGRYNFSANCGWIDWSHADGSLAQELIARVRKASDALRTAGSNAKDTTGDLSSPTMTSGIPHTGIVLSSASVNVRLLQPLSATEILSVALSIFKTLSIAFEAQQEWTDLLGKSSFAQEDLPSDLLSFYMAAKGYTKDDIKRFCAAVGPDESLKEYDRNHDFKKNKTFNPIGATGPWPAELSTIDDSQAASLYETRTINTNKGTESFTFCPIYRVEGTINDTDLIITSVGGTKFTAADNLRVVPTYKANSATMSYGHVNLIEVVPYGQADAAAFAQHKIPSPIKLSQYQLVCLTSRGNSI